MACSLPKKNRAQYSSARAIWRHVATDTLLNLVPRTSHFLPGNEFVLLFRDKPARNMENNEKM